MKAKNLPVFFFWLILWVITALTVRFKTSTNQGLYNLNNIFSGFSRTLFFYLFFALLIWILAHFLFKKIPFLSKLDIKKSLILWLIFFLFITSCPWFIKKPVQNQKSKKFSSSILKAINKERQKKDLSPLVLDGRLCAFAKQKALEYAQGIAETKTSFANQIHSPDNAVYFSRFKQIVLDSLTEGIGQTDTEIAQTFMLRKNKGAATPSLTHGCVANSIGAETGRFYTVFIGGVIEKK